MLVSDTTSPHIVRQQYSLLRNRVILITLAAMKMRTDILYLPIGQLLSLSSMPELMLLPFFCFFLFAKRPSSSLHVSYLPLFSLPLLIGQMEQPMLTLWPIRLHRPYTVRQADYTWRPFTIWRPMHCLISCLLCQLKQVCVMHCLLFIAFHNAVLLVIAVSIPSCTRHYPITRFATCLCSCSSLMRVSLLLFVLHSIHLCVSVCIAHHSDRPAVV